MASRSRNLAVRLRDKRSRTEAAKRRVKAARHKTMAVLGAWCAHCGIDDERVLQIDHINGDGYKVKKQGQRDRELQRVLSRGQVAMYYQVLCANCHVIKTIEKGERIGRQKTNGHDHDALPLFSQVNQPNQERNA